MIKQKFFKPACLIPKHFCSPVEVDQESWIQDGSKHLITQLILTELHSRSDVAHCILLAVVYIYKMGWFTVCLCCMRSAADQLIVRFSKVEYTGWFFSSSVVKLLGNFCYQEYVEKAQLGTERKCFKHANCIFVVSRGWLYCLWQNKHM